MINFQHNYKPPKYIWCIAIKEKKERKYMFLDLNWAFLTKAEAKEAAEERWEGCDIVYIKYKLETTKKKNDDEGRSVSTMFLPD